MKYLKKKNNMQYFVILNQGKDWEILDDTQFKDFIEIAVIHNKDVAEFVVITIDSRLTTNQATFIGYISGFKEEISTALKNGDSPFEAVTEWIK